MRGRLPVARRMLLGVTGAALLAAVMHVPLAWSRYLDMCGGVGMATLALVFAAEGKVRTWPG